MSNIVKRELLYAVGAGSYTLSFYLDVKTLSFDYVKRSRDCQIEVVAVSDYPSSVSLTGSGSYLSVLGAKLSLPSSLTLSAGQKVIKTFTASNISEAQYGGSADYELYLTYTGGVFGLESPVKKNASVTFPKIYDSPEAVLIKSALILGEDLILNGTFLNVGYDVTARVMVEGEQVYEGAVTKAGERISTRRDWITPYPTKNELSASVILSASHGGASLPSTLTLPFTLTLGVSDGQPTIASTVKAVSENESLSELGIAVKNKSRFSAEVESVIPKYGAYITDVYIVFSGRRVNAYSYTSDILTEAGSYSYWIRATDSRGYSTTKSGTFEVLEYTPPIVVASVKRVNQNGDEDVSGQNLCINASVEGEYDFEGSNTYSLYYQIARVGEESLPAKTEFEAGKDVIIDASLDGESSYNVYITCIDSLGSKVVRKFTVDSRRIELNIAKNKIGVGKYAEKDGVFDSAWPIRSEGDIIFADAGGNEISLRSMLAAISAMGAQAVDAQISGGVGFRYASVENESELSLIMEGVQGVTLLIAKVGNESEKLYLCYNCDKASGKIRLATE